MASSLWRNIGRVAVPLLICACSAGASEQNSGPAPDRAARIALHPEDLALLARVIAEIGNEYIEPRTGHELLMSAMNRMVNSLDPHSALIENATQAGLRDAMRGEFAGIGVELEIREGYPTVVSTIPDSPARGAGLRPGDRLDSVDGTNVRGAQLDRVIAMIKGPPRSSVRLGLQRTGDTALRELTLERRLVRFRSVEVETNDEFALVRVSEFVDMTTRELVDLLANTPVDKLRKGLVLDMRGNPGGVVDAAVELASLFLPPQVLVMTIEGRAGTKALPRLTSPQYQPAADSASLRSRLLNLLLDVPLFVLVDGQTASSAEIVAAALQAHRRAVIVGCENTMGKGSIQSIIQLTDRYALKMTTARYRTPGGRFIDGTGVTPDVPVSARANCEADPSLAIEVARRELRLKHQQARSSTDSQRRAGS